MTSNPPCSGSTRRLAVAGYRCVDGFALVTALILLLLLASSVTTALLGSGLQTRIVSNLQDGLQAYYCAQAGIQHAFVQLSRDAQWRNSIPQTALGRGTYSVTLTQAAAGGDITLTAIGRTAGAERRITVTLRILLITVAGTGTAAYTGDGGRATAATLKQPAGGFVDVQGNLFIADQLNHAIRMVRPGADGVITGAADEFIYTVAGTGLDMPYCVAGDTSLGNCGDGGPAKNGQIKQSTSVFVNPQGNLYVAHQAHNRVRLVTPGADGVVTGAADELIYPLVGTGFGAYGGDGGAATAAQLKTPMGVFMDPRGNLFIADAGNNRVRRRILRVISWRQG